MDLNDDPHLRELQESRPEDWLPSSRFAEWQGCRRCRHFSRGRCAAYPWFIPLPLVSGETDHLVPRPGDRGLRFEPKEVAP